MDEEAPGRPVHHVGAPLCLVDADAAELARGSRWGVGGQHEHLQHAAVGVEDLHALALCDDEDPELFGGGDSHRFVEGGVGPDHA